MCKIREVLIAVVQIQEEMANVQLGHTGENMRIVNIFCLRKLSREKILTIFFRSHGISVRVYLLKIKMAPIQRNSFLFYLSREVDNTEDTSMCRVPSRR